MAELRLPGVAHPADLGLHFGPGFVVGRDGGDGFESGSFSAWSSSATGSGRLSVSAAAAMNGSGYGMQAVLNGTATPILVTDSTPNAEKHYQARFYFDPNSASMNGTYPSILYAQQSNGDIIINVKLSAHNGAYYVQLTANNNTTAAGSATGTYLISDAGDDHVAHCFEFDWQAASTETAADGSMTFWIDGVQRGSVANMANGSRQIDTVKLGAVGNISTGISGTWLFDDFVSRNAGGYIGLAAAAPGSDVAALALKTLARQDYKRQPVPANAQPPSRLADYTTGTTIDYTYDALHRLASASYSTGERFEYTYDAMGNTLTRIQNLAGTDVTTTYTYNETNQLVSAQESSNSVVWSYAYDNAGRLTEIRPDGVAGEGGRRYTYNAAGLLTRAEVYSSGAYQLQAEMVYNGLGERVQMTGWAEGQSATTVYTIDMAAPKRNPLLANTAGNVTFYLYAKNKPIGERIAGWSYYQNDGLSVPRQMSDAAGIITLARTYTPWGEVLKQAGTGNFTWGYFGGLMDAATGLLYVGGGQYYDPATGRFLTPANREGNPYLPGRIDPLGAVLGPVALAALLVRRKKKAGKWDQWFVGLILVVGLGMGASACGRGGTTPTPTPLPGSDVIIFSGSGDNFDGYGIRRANSVVAQMHEWTTDPFGNAIPSSNFIDYPGYIGNKSGKPIQAELARGVLPGLPVTLIGYSAGTESVLMYARWRLDNGQNVRAVVLLGPTYVAYQEDNDTSEQPTEFGTPDSDGQFNDWADYMDYLLIKNVDILVVDDRADGGYEATPESFQKTAGAPGNLYYVYEDVEHYTSGDRSSTNNSPEIKAKVYNWIKTKVYGL